MGPIVTLVVVVAFAALVRAMLGATGVSWPRLLLTSAVGYVLGITATALLIVGPLDEVEVTDLQLSVPDLAVAALPLQVLVTMALLVVVELVRSRPPRSRPRRPPHPLRAARRRVDLVRRGWQVSRVAARTGVGPLVGVGRAAPDVADVVEAARRLREAIEELGGVYVKLGQLVASRPDLLPPQAAAELGALHAQVRPLPTDVVREVVAAELGPPGTVLAHLDEQPLGSASIAQVHAGRLPDGREVVVKVRRPGLEDDVERDLAILAWVARNAARRLAWARTYGVQELAEDLGAQLRQELDFRNEARVMAEVAATLDDVPALHAPEVIRATARVLVMERLHGAPVSATPAPEDGAALADALCRSQVRAMIGGERFHADPHPGNVLVLSDGRLGLVDFGMTGRLDAFGRVFVQELLAAVRLRDPGMLYEALLTAGSVDPAADPDPVERELAAFLAAHLTAGLPTPEAMTALVRLTAQMGIAFPAQAALMLRAVGTLAGTLEILSPGYPFVDQVAAVAGDAAVGMTAPASAAELLQREWGTLGPVLRRAPRHLDRIATQLEHGRLVARVSLLAQPEDRRVLDRLLDRALLTVLGLGLLAVSVAMIAIDAGPALITERLSLLQLLGWVGLFVGAVLVLRVLLEVLRPATTRDPREPRPPRGREG